MKTGLKLAIAAVVAIAATAATRPNWNNTVADTAEGWHRLGNPAAKIRLIEFVSYTCPHCSHFETEGGDAIKVAYVAPGTASLEVHHVVRDPIDLTAALLANCGPKEKFFLNHTAILRQQPKWLPPLAKRSDASTVRWRSGPMADRFKAIASDAGFYALMQSRGYTRQQVDACLADTAKAESIIARSNASNQKYGIKSTPSFAINGETLADVHDWDKLKPVLAERAK
jgi:protein-disulfide isomerase